MAVHVVGLYCCCFFFFLAKYANIRFFFKYYFVCLPATAETAAFFHFLEPNEAGRIDCRRFVFEFLNLGKLERSRHTRRQQEIVVTRKQAEVERVADINER